MAHFKTFVTTPSFISRRYWHTKYVNLPNGALLFSVIVSVKWPQFSIFRDSRWCHIRIRHSDPTIFSVFWAFFCKFSAIFTVFTCNSFRSISIDFRHFPQVPGGGGGGDGDRMRLWESWDPDIDSQHRAYRADSVGDRVSVRLIMCSRHYVEDRAGLRVTQWLLFAWNSKL